jgi:hypothetical protein
MLPRPRRYTDHLTHRDRIVTQQPSNRHQHDTKLVPHLLLAWQALLWEILGVELHPYLQGVTNNLGAETDL